MDNGPGTQEEKRLEEGMSHQVEESGEICGGPHGKNHVAKLGDGRVRQHLLDVALGDGNGRRPKSGEGANGGHDRLSGRRQLEDGRGAGNQIDAGGHHRGRVDESRDWSGAFHGIWQPHVERYLSRLAYGSGKKEQGNGCRHACGQLSAGPLKDSGVGECAESGKDQHQSDEKTEVTNPVDDEGLLGRRCSRRSHEPEADEQIGAKTHQLPPEKEHGVVTGEDEGQHRSCKQIEVGEEAGEPLVAVHVADGEHVNQGTDSSDDHRHEGRQGIPEHLEVGSDRRHPLPEQHGGSVLTSLEERNRGDECNYERGGDRPRRQPATPGLFDVTTKEVKEHRAQERQRNDEPDDLDHT